MHPLTFVVLSTVLGLDYGWKPLSGGGNEVVVVVDRDSINRLEQFNIETDVPAGLDVRRVRITYDREPLSRVTPVNGYGNNGYGNNGYGNNAGEPNRFPNGWNMKPMVAGFNDPEPQDEERLPRNSSPFPRNPNGTVINDRVLDTRPRSSMFDSNTTNRDYNSRDYVDNRAPVSRGYSTNTRPGYDSYDRPLVRNDSNLRNDGFRTDTRPRTNDFVDAPLQASVPRFGSDRGSPLLNDDYEAPRSASLALKPNSTADIRPNSSRALGLDDNNAYTWATFAFFALFLSMGANLYLGWIAFEARDRYRQLLDKFRTTRSDYTMPSSSYTSRRTYEEQVA